MFNFIAEILEILYRHIWDSYGMTIILLTILIRVAVSPLTVRSTRSMLELRKVQPHVRKLQAQYKHDRPRLNQELQELYREHSINPLGGCLPLLIQMPIFLVMYQVIRGLTRRASDVGFALGKGLGLVSGGNTQELVSSSSSLVPGERANFNPDWLDSDDEMFLDLAQDNEMISWGLDLALTPWRALTDDVVRGLPYLLLIIITGVLSYYQQRQIQGRSSEEPNPQQRIIMRIIPIFIPIISFSLPMALVIYFLTTNVVGVAQQAFLTRRIYKPHAEKQKLEGNGTEDIIDVDVVKTDPDPPPKPKGLLGALGGGTPAEGPKHGTSPLSKAPKAVPPKAGQKKKPPAASPPPPAPNNQKSNNQKNNNQKNNGNQRKNVSKNQLKNGKGGKTATPEPPKKTSKRVTPKKQIDDQNRRRRR